MGPVSGALALKVAGAAAGGVASFGQAQAERKQASINAFIGRTRAIQTDTSAREGLNSELGQMRNVMGANQQKAGVGTFEVMQELRDTRNRERRVDVGNRNSEAASSRMKASAAGSRGLGALVGAGIKAGPSLFDLNQYRKAG
tara:strand:+ start:32112 stop:32540 length:429 start_codon:yes stop_codon:yes gene_type:complete